MQSTCVNRERRSLSGHHNSGGAQSEVFDSALVSARPAKEYRLYY